MRVEDFEFGDSFGIITVMAESVVAVSDTLCSVDAASLDHGNFCLAFFEGIENEVVVTVDIGDFRAFNFVEVII